MNPPEPKFVPPRRHVVPIGVDVGASTAAGGTLQASAAFAATVPLTLTGSGGSANINTNGYDVALSGALSGSGGFNKLGPGTLTLSGANSYMGLTSVQAGTLWLGTTAAENPIFSLGGVDIQGGSLVLSYSGLSPAITIASILATGYKQDFAAGSGEIFSSTAATNGSTLGWADNGSNAIRIMATLPGDANLDGQVDINDLTIVLSNFGTTSTVLGAVWSQGDFTYDGKVDINDLTIVLSNFGQTYAALGGSMRMASVPEPGSLALIAVGVFALLGCGGRGEGSWLVLLRCSWPYPERRTHADVLNMPNGEASLQFVTVGNPNNRPDTVVMTDGTTGYGSVPYVYDIGKYDVTVGQYVQFLNAVAATDTYGVYNSGMALGSPDGMPTVGIVQSGSPGSYTYSVSYNWAVWTTYYLANFPSLYPSGLAAAADCPIFDVSWGDAARFCNWLQNGEPIGPEGNGTTETGAYTLTGGTSDSALMGVTRSTGASYFIPSENEWYKAAYYNPTSGMYWKYETQSNTAPINVLSASGTNNANVYDFYGTGEQTYTDPTNYLTPVGAFVASPGPYGTYDMGGDVFQWNEGNISHAYRCFRGGSWSTDIGFPRSSYRDYAIYVNTPEVECDDIGFRVASIPEPGDANGDGRVDINDLTIVLSNFGQTGMAWSQGCMDGDPLGIVDINDLTIVLAHYNTTYGASSGIKAVPEPSTLVVLGVGAACLVALAWRRRR